MKCGACRCKYADTHQRIKTDNPIYSVLKEMSRKNCPEDQFYCGSCVDKSARQQQLNETPQPVCYDNDAIELEEFRKIPGSTLGIDALVTAETGTCPPFYGVIRAIFKIGSITMVGLELEEFMSFAPLDITDGSFSGRRFFNCQNGKALFIEAKYCHKDNRFSNDVFAENKAFGHLESPIVMDKISPINLKNQQELEGIIGESKGIQGHNNSCYLDAILFSMFTFVQCFDFLLYSNVESKDIEHNDEVRAILRDAIVHPLRKHHFVRADRVLKFRQKLEEVSTTTGWTKEEFINVLMAQTLKAEPYIKFNSGLDAYWYQLFVEKNEEWKLPSVQQLFEQSLNTSKIQLREVPPFLIIQMPRYGKKYKMYPRILPSQVLDITDVLEGQYYQESRIHMDLFAVVCIETSHYVSFVKAGELPDAPWIFFDSMFDRRGGQHGYNIPSMVYVPEVLEWLSEEGSQKLLDFKLKDKIPPLVKRLLCDASMCMYVIRDEVK